MMICNEFACEFNMPPAIKDGGKVHGLPPYAKQKAYCVDDYECPSNWMHGSEKAASYFVGVKPDHGMWLDFNACSSLSHHVAIVVSIQGINPITGLRTKGVSLERYDKCPTHDADWDLAAKATGKERFCKQCGFEWPLYNFLSSTSQPGTLWIDGFRSSDGIVRQYVFTADESKGVAAQLIGDERVFAIGVAFFKCKQPKPVPVTFTGYGGYGSDTKIKYFVPYNSGGHGGFQDFDADNSNYYDGTPQISCSTGAMFSAGGGTTSSSGTSRGILRTASLNSLEVGAGAEIKQRIVESTLGIDDFESTPSGFIYVNYANTDMLESILSKPLIKKNGFLSGLQSSV